MPQATSKPLRIARLVISLGLILGVGVFGILAINDLTKPITPTSTNANTYGASDALPGQTRETRTLPGDVQVKQSHPLLELAINPNAIPIDHHPGSFTPFRDSAAFLQPPYREPIKDNIVWELCAYRVPDATPQQAFEHYNSQAKLAGLILQTRGNTSEEIPGGIKATWSAGKRSLELVAWPTAEAEPPPPPLKPKPPLEWVVKYSYPVPADTK